MSTHFAIYTTIVGGYDVVKQPLVVDDRFDYILFTDDLSQKKIGIWEVRPIPYQDENLVRLSRYPKLLPTKVLPEYEASLYIDGTLQIATSFVYERFVELYDKKVEWAGIKHYYRNCLYEEMRAIVGAFGKGVHDYDCIEWYAKIKNEGFPAEYGLYENNVIYRKHNTNIERIGNEWWISMQHYCKRDQFSLMYLFWKYPITRDYFLIPKEDAKHTEHFVYTLHYAKREMITLDKMGCMERLRVRCWQFTPWHDQWYGYVLERCYKFPIQSLSLPLWSVFAFFRYAIWGLTKRKIHSFKS